MLRLIDESKRLTQTLRTMRFLALALTIFLVTVATMARAEGERVRVLSLDDCIKLALEHNLDIQVARLNPELDKFSLRAAYGSYEPALSLSGSRAYQESTSGTQSETDSFRGGVGGLLPWGMNYNLGLRMSDSHGTFASTTSDLANPTLATNTFNIAGGGTIDYLSTNYPSLSTRTIFDDASANGGAFELRQPLLKDFWTDSTRLTIFINKNNLKSSELSLRDQIMLTITRVERAYYNVIYADENVKVQEKALQLAEQLVTDNRRRVELGALAPLDEKQAESQAAASRANLLDGRAGHDSAQRNLKSLMSDDYKEWLDATVQASETLKAVPQKFELFKSWRKGEVARPDLLIARLSLESQDEQVKLARNQKLPSLDVVGNAGYTGSGNEFSSAFRDIRGKDYPYYTYGLEMTVPLGNTVARNRYKSSQTTREKLALRYKQIEQAALISIETSISQGRTSLERVEATRQASLYAEDALKAEQTKLDKGKSTSFIVLQLQRELTAARSAEIRALADYNIALAELAYNEGSTLERRNVDLKVK